MPFPSTKIIAVLLAGATLAATAGEAFADRNQYTHRHLGGYGYRHRGIGPGGIAAGAALGIAGAAIAGAAANNYYNGYRSYPYGDGGYGRGYGYDYIPDHGYYGPY